MMKSFIVSFCVLFFVGSLQVRAQFDREDNFANFSSSKSALVWQKSYPVVEDEYLDQVLRSHPFSAVLDISRFQNSAETGLFRLGGENLPEYARHDFKAFLYVDELGGEVRITVKQIVFPDFQEKIYWNGMRQSDSRGSLEQYILGQDGRIKRNNTNERVLREFDNFFSSIFDALGQ